MRTSGPFTFKAFMHSQGFLNVVLCPIGLLAKLENLTLEGEYLEPQPF